MTKEELLQAMAQSIISGEIEDSSRLAKQALEMGVDPLEAIEHGYLVGMHEVGEAYAAGEMFLPDLVFAGDAMKEAMRILEPELTRLHGSREAKGKVILGSVQGDIHEIGKNLVGTMLSANGFEVVDLGVSVPSARFLEKAREIDADIIGMSALLTTTMARQGEVIRMLDEAGMRPRVKVMVGGAPVTSAWAEEIHADGYAANAQEAVQLALWLVENTAQS